MGSCPDIDIDPKSSTESGHIIRCLYTEFV